MKNQNIVLIAIASALAFALTAVTEAAPNPGGIATHDSAINAPSPQGGPASASATNAPAVTASTNPEAVGFPVITIHSAGNILRGNTGSFVLATSSALPSGGSSGASGMYVNFKVGGTAVAGVDYVPFLSPAFLNQSGYGVISVQTLQDPRATSNNQAYSVEVTLQPGAGYAVGQPSSAKLLISTNCVLQACW